MKKILLPFVLVFVISSSFAQVGMYTGLEWINAPQWEELFRSNYEISSISIFSSSGVVGIDLAYSSSKRGLRFSPQLSFSRYQTAGTYEYSLIDFNDLIITETQTDEYSLSFAGLSSNLDWYVLDFHTPAKTPVYEKTGHWFKKGFFIRFAPSIQAVSTKKNHRFFNPLSSLVPGVRSARTQLAAALKMGIGCDFGITNVISLSPILSYGFMPKTKWNGFGVPSNFRDDFFKNSDLFYSRVHQFQVAIRLGFHFKQLNNKN